MKAIRVEGALFVVKRRDPDLERLRDVCQNAAGLAVEYASDGLQGLRRAKLLRPRLLLTEVILPGLDGLSICRALRQDPETSATRLMMVSILAAEERAREVGVDAFLRRPVDGDQLVGSLFRLLGRRSGTPWEAGLTF